MLTKKEKLLIRPWIVKKYKNHREKVRSAAPAIDFGCPPRRAHVVVKHKKKQKEAERRDEIERENVRLIQKLAVIMNTLRLDNFWKDSRPNFLSREVIYKSRPNSKASEEEQKREETPIEILNLRGSAKRCSACNKTQKPRQRRPNQISPSPAPRIPWSHRNCWNKTLDFEPEDVHVCCRFCC